jgi:outer membrane protein assembly factor BamB
MADTNRRRFLKSLSASPIAIAGGCLSTPGDTSGPQHPVSEPVTDWSSFRGDSHNTGFARGVAPTGAEPTIEWTFDTDGAVWASPVVVDGTVYIGSTDGSLYAIDGESGDELWATPTEDRIEGSPAHADGTVYAGSYDRRVHAIDAATGDRRWKRDLDGLIRGSPTVKDDAVVIGVGCHNLACAEYAAETDLSTNGWVYSLDVASGETNWRYEVGDEVVSSPAVVGDTVYVG